LKDLIQASPWKKNVKEIFGFEPGCTLGFENSFFWPITPAVPL